MSDFDTPPGEPYAGPPGVARDSVWLTNEDLPHDKDSTLVIDTVIRRDKVKFQGGRVKPVVLSLRFKNVKSKRELGLNATNRKTLVALFGPKCSDWYGQAIKLYVKQGVRYPDGTEGPAVRIRAQRIKPPADGKPEPGEAAATPATDPTDEYADIPAEREPGIDDN